MKLILAGTLPLLLAVPAAADHISFDGRGLCGRGHGGGHDFSIHGHRGWDYDGDLQSYFEDAFAQIVDDYDTGLAEIEDYYASDNYVGVLDSLERLVTR
ncbi:hypothetical protein Pla123a_19380 [Posidoniimonas polymericola]|uniref:Uncharacterized protein n=1 Tax=Posidoniimonas polymericola TaxID=2528002 RepID=A0A5C5YQS3_9BACT|nr:hypothetical protein [Posidoniimonas polymericola]TWT77281.1 hypothetical protein Pla123a_19380 [Posidoniimonas polymericola]